MAWTFRKRKRILPGVRLNIGRKGISTTVGPRGASVTFGPNGTYLNTSIPGTGLYNRQRIGGTNTNTQMASDNSGCKEVFIGLLSIALWILVILTAVAGFAFNVWAGCVMVGVLILTHVIIAISSKEKPQQDYSKITEEYYNQVSKAAEDLYADYEKVLELQDIDTLIDSMGVKFVMNGSPMTNVKEKVRLLFWLDVTRCYTGLGHNIDLNSKEGLGLLYFIALTNGCKTQIPFANLVLVKSTYQGNAESILKGIKAYIDSAPNVQEMFLLSRLLSKNDTKMHRKFLVDIYRFASLTAKADNTVTEEEAKWLGNIIKLQGSGNQESTQQEERSTIDPIYEEVDERRLDPLFADAARWIVANQDGRIDQIQRAMAIGPNRAIKLLGQLQDAGVVEPVKGSNEREVLIKDPAKLEQLLMKLLGSNYTANNETSSQTTTKSTTKPRTQSPSKMLNELIGLESVKKEVETLSNFIKIQQTRATKGLKTSAVSYHCVFTGNPGTGKTTVARILAKIYKSLGVVSKGHFVETDRAGLVAEYVGQTAVKTNKIIDSALDGVLFIDEAYSLIGGGESDYGKEAVATLLKRMEDDRDRLVVILAGYTKNMKDFIDSNPGLQSRFNRYIEFPDYSAEELLQIFEASMKKYDYHFGEGAKEALLQYFENEVAHKDANFGNGRLVRNVFEKTLEKQANRLAREVNLTTDKLSQIVIEDLPIK